MFESNGEDAVPIKIICEKRHHIGECDISYPAVFCDACGERITNAAEANYYWRPDYDMKEDSFYDQKHDVFFLHCECDGKMAALRERNKGHFNLQTPFGILNSKNVDRPWQPLEAFPLWLGLNLEMNINATDMRRYKSHDIKGKDITANTYPADSEGWVYFVVDNGSIERKMKIGHSTDVHARIRNMQTGSPTILKCYGAIQGTPDDEKLAHALLNDHHSHGEWFVFERVQMVIDNWLSLGKICPSVVETK